MSGLVGGGERKMEREEGREEEGRRGRRDGGKAGNRQESMNEVMRGKEGGKMKRVRGDGKVKTHFPSLLLDIPQWWFQTSLRQQAVL